MRCDSPIYLSAPASYLGESVDTAATAVAEGRIDAAVATKYGYEQLTVSELAPVQMASVVARQTLAEAGVRGTELSAVLHAWTHFQGHEFWSPAHYIAAQVNAPNAAPIGIAQMCNGGMAAIDLASKQLIADPASGEVLVTTADRFAAPTFDRWSGDLGVCYGDGATAVLVGREPRARSARLWSVATAAAAELEEMHRGDAPFQSSASGPTQLVSPRKTKTEFHVRSPGLDLRSMAHAAMRKLISTTLDEAGLSPADPRLAVIALPRLSKNGLDDVYRGAIADACQAPIWDLGGRTGHLGAGDAMANLADLSNDPRIAPGQFAILIGAGAGFTWSTAVVEVIQ